MFIFILILLKNLFFWVLVKVTLEFYDLLQYVIVMRTFTEILV